MRDKIPGFVCNSGEKQRKKARLATALRYRRDHTLFNYFLECKIKKKEEPGCCRVSFSSTPRPKVFARVNICNIQQEFNNGGKTYHPNRFATSVCIFCRYTSRLVQFDSRDERKKKKRKELLLSATRGAFIRFILIPRTCRHPKPCHRGQCHCHSETVKVWSFCVRCRAHFCSSRSRVCTAGIRTAHAFDTSHCRDSLVFQAFSTGNAAQTQR